MGVTGTEERIRLAEAFLQEAVYRSRDAQAGEALLSPAAASCGLGEKAAVVLDVTDRGREHFDALWPEGLPEEALEGVRERMAAWIRRQDALDRKRNHFLKDFRREHGFDRAAYSDEQATAYRAGLDRVNGEVDEARRAAAEELCAIA